MRRQRGISLISTMIGLLIGMLGVVTMTAIYVTQSTQTERTRQSSALDGQSALGIVVAQLELQRAGFGVASDTNSCFGPSDPGPSGTANEDFVLIRDAAFDTGGFTAGSAVDVPAPGGTEDEEPDLAVDGNAVAWHWVDADGDSQCAALVGDGERLLLLSDTDCATATDWDSLNWGDDEIAVVMVNGAPTFSAYRSATGCSPFGRLPQGSGLYVSIRVGQSVAGMNSSSTLCIPNICQ